MNDQRPTRDSMFIEEATVSNMWEIAAIVEGLERESGVLYYGSEHRSRGAPGGTLPTKTTS